MVRSLWDPALGDQVSGYEPALAVTDAPLPSVAFGTFDVSHVASSVAAFCRAFILHNSPLNIARAIKTACAERCAIECRARETGSIVSGLLTTYLRLTTHYSPLIRVTLTLLTHCVAPTC